MPKHTLILLLAACLLLAGCSGRHTRLYLSATFPPVVTPAPLVSPGTEDTVVYVTEYGKKYHLDPHCSAIRNPEELRQLTLAEAAVNKYPPCARCASGE